MTRYDDVAAVLLDDERFVRDPRNALSTDAVEERAATFPLALEAIENHMLNRDGEDHRRLRRLVTKAFTPKMVEQLRPRIQAIADEPLDAVEPRRGMDLEHPDQLGLLREDPSLIPGAVEEILRFEGPVERSLNRWAATDVELGEQTIRKGDLVIPILGSAARDPDRYADADTLDVRRDDVRHVAFGRGSHYCLGAPLARLEAQVALETLFRRLPDLRLAVPRRQLEWRPTPGFRRPVALPVVW